MTTSGLGVYVVAILCAGGLSAAQESAVAVSSETADSSIAWIPALGPSVAAAEEDGTQPRFSPASSGDRGQQQYPRSLTAGRAADPLNTSIVGFCLSFFHYHELFPEDELLKDYNVDRIAGEPKSAEYGLCQGVHVETVRRVRMSGVFLRSKLGAVLGLLHRYDGSTQPRIMADSTGRVAVFDPARGVKNNWFLNGALDVGVGPLVTPSRGVTLWSGIGGRLWKRMLWGDIEYYYWFDLPLGLWAYAAAGRHWTLGLEASVRFMLAGWMKLVLEPEAGEQSPNVPAVRLSDSVPFGRRASFAVSVPLALHVARNVSIRFVPWFEYYRFGRSNSECLDGGACTEPGDRWFYEPASRTFGGGLGTDIVVHRRPQR